MLSHQGEQAVPVEARAGRVKNVRDVRSIESFASRDEEFRSKQFFGSQHASGYTNDHSGVCALDPLLVHRDHTIAHPRDEIDEEIGPERFDQPNPVRDFAPITDPFKAFQGVRNGWAWQGNIQILCGVPDARMPLQGKCARNGVPHMAFVQGGQYFAKECRLLLSEQWRIGRTGARDCFWLGHAGLDGTFLASGCKSLIHGMIQERAMSRENLILLH